MSAIYHIIKNGVAVAVTSTGTAVDSGYFGEYNASGVKQSDLKNPPPNSPLPSGNWREGGKTTTVHIGGKGKK